MVRTIKRISHDLIPLSDAVSELSLLVTGLLEAVQDQLVSENSKVKGYLEECTLASQNLALSAQLIKRYIVEVDEEADRNGITED